MAKTIKLSYQSHAVSLHLIYRIWYWRNYSGYSLNDLAFLADIDLKLLRSIEDPTLRAESAKQFDKTEYELPRISVGEYDLDQLDFIRGVFYQIELKDLVPKEFFSDDLIKITAVAEISPGKRQVKIYRSEPNGRLQLLYDFDKTGIAREPLNFSQNLERIKGITESLISLGYFDQPRLALEIYRQIINEYKLTPKPIILEKAIRYFTGKKKGIRLERQKKRDSHTLFIKIQ